MFQAIAAVIGAVFGFATGVNNTANAQYTFAQGQMQDRIEYARRDATRANTTYYVLIGGIAIVVLTIIVVMAINNLKKKG